MSHADGFHLPERVQRILLIGASVLLTALVGGVMVALPTLLS